MKIESITIRPLKVDTLHISWVFTKTLESFQDFAFTLERSESPESGFIAITTFNHTTEYIDELYYRRLWKNLYYRVKIENKRTGAISYSIVGSLMTPPNLEALEIIRRNDILLRNRRHGTGVPVAVFTKKRIGPACECWDVDKQRLRTSNCRSCYGSHIHGGFYSPIISWANFTPNTKLIQIPQWGEMEPNEQRLFMSNYPVLSPGDVIFEPSSMSVYTVEKIETSERRGTMLHQIVSASFIDRNSALYSLLDETPDLIERLKTEASRIKRS